MEWSTLLGLVFRWLHILAAIAAVGGSLFARFVVLPVLAPLPDVERSTLHAAMRARFAKIVAASIAFLLVSGLYNFLVLVANYELPRWYHPLFGVKFLLAFAIFAIASLLVGSSPAAEALRKNTRTWMNVNLTLAVLVVCISGVLRTADRVPKVKPAEASAAGQATGFASPRAVD
jgi:uncharacterized membrane protein